MNYRTETLIITEEAENALTHYIEHVTIAAQGNGIQRKEIEDARSYAVDFLSELAKANPHAIPVFKTYTEELSKHDEYYALTHRPAKKV